MKFKTERDLTITNAVELYESGLSGYEIAQQYHCSPGTVIARVRMGGATIRGQGGMKGKSKRPKLHAKQIAFMYEELEMTQTEIAKVMGLKHPSSIRPFLIREGVERRSKAETNRIAWEVRNGERVCPVASVKRARKAA